MLYLAVTDRYGNVIEGLTEEIVEAIVFCLEEYAGSGDLLIDALAARFRHEKEKPVAV